MHSSGTFLLMLFSVSEIMWYYVKHRPLCKVQYVKLNFDCSVKEQHKNVTLLSLLCAFSIE